jgi:hypothetical protein
MENKDYNLGAKHGFNAGFVTGLFVSILTFAMFCLIFSIL